MIRALLRSIFLWAIAAFLLIPFAIVAGVSLNPARQIAFPPQSVSGAWFVEMATDRGWQVAIWNSFSIAFIAAMLATCSRLARRLRPVAARHVAVAVGICTWASRPYMVPPIILALGASVFWAEVGLYGSRWATTHLPRRALCDPAVGHHFTRVQCPEPRDRGRQRHQRRLARHRHSPA